MLRQVIEAGELLADPRTDGAAALDWLRAQGPGTFGTERLEAERGHTDVVRIRVGAGSGPVLGILGVLGGTGVRPERPGLVSDADGAVVALAVAAALLRAEAAGDALSAPVLISTHICPRALSRPHRPAPMMTCPVPRARVLAAQLDPAMEAIVSIDAARANRVCNRSGFAITPTAWQGWVLRVGDDLLDLQEAVTGEPPLVLPIATQDITPYAEGVRHINSILQPATLTGAPVVGVALTARAIVAGSATGAGQPWAQEAAGRFCVEVARGFGARRIVLHDAAEAARLVALYGPLDHLSRAAAKNAATQTKPTAASNHGTGP